MLAGCARTPLVEYRANLSRNVDVAPLAVTPDEIRLPDTPFANHRIDCHAVILYVKPVTHVQPFSINRNRISSQSRPDHGGDELLRMLVRSVVVRAVRHR